MTRLLVIRRRPRPRRHEADGSDTIELLFVGYLMPFLTSPRRTLAAAQSGRKTLGGAA